MKKTSLLMLSAMVLGGLTVGIRAEEKECPACPGCETKPVADEKDKGPSCPACEKEMKKDDKLVCEDCGAALESGKCGHCKNDKGEPSAKKGECKGCYDKKHEKKDEGKGGEKK